MWSEVLLMARVTTIDKCFDILEALSRGEGRGMGVRALARHLETNVTSVHNMCRTMCERGYLWQDPQSKRFQLGLGLSVLGRGEQVAHRLVAVADPIVRACQEELDESILLATMIGTSELVTLSYLPSSQALRVHEPHTMGSRAYATAVGKMLLSGLQEDQLESYLQRFPPKRFTSHTIVDLAGIRDELRVTCQRAVGQTSDELTIGVSAVAVSVPGPDQRLFAALGASAPTVRFDAAEMARTGELLRGYAAQLQVAWFPGA